MEMRVDLGSGRDDSLHPGPVHLYTAFEPGEIYNQKVRGAVDCRDATTNSGINGR